MNGILAFLFGIGVQFAILAGGVVAIGILIFVLGTICDVMDWANAPWVSREDGGAAYSFRQAVLDMLTIGKRAVGIVVTLMMWALAIVLLGVAAVGMVTNISKL